MGTAPRVSLAPSFTEHHWQLLLGQSFVDYWGCWFLCLHSIHGTAKKKSIRVCLLKPVLNWTNVCLPEHTSDTSTNYDSFLNWTFSLPNMVRTVQTLLYSQLACNEMQALARTCGRRAADSMIENVGLSQVSFWVLRDKATPSTSQQINKFPSKRVKNLATPSSIFIFVFSPFTGELCSQPIRGNDRPIGRMFPEHVERRFLDPEYSLDEYFQLGSRRKVGPIKNQLALPNTSN